MQILVMLQGYCELHKNSKGLDNQPFKISGFSCSRNPLKLKGYAGIPFKRLKCVIKHHTGYCMFPCNCMWWLL